MWLSTFGKKKLDQRSINGLQTTIQDPQMRKEKMRHFTLICLQYQNHKRGKENQRMIHQTTRHHPQRRRGFNGHLQVQTPTSYDLPGLGQVNHGVTSFLTGVNKRKWLFKKAIGVTHELIKKALPLPQAYYTSYFGRVHPSLLSFIGILKNLCEFIVLWWATSSRRLLVKAAMSSH